MLGNKRSVGMEINESQVKAVEMIPSPRRNRLLNYAVAKIDPEKGEAGLIEAVRSVLSSLKVKANMPVNLSISSRDVDLQWINRPKLNPDGQSPAHYQYRAGCPRSESEVIHDEYSVKHLDRKNNRRSPLIRIEAKRHTIDKYQKLIRSAGFNCGEIEIEPLSLLNCFINSGPVVENDVSVALINVDLKKTTINIIRNGVLRDTRDMAINWEKLLETLPSGFTLDCNASDILQDLENGDVLYREWVYCSNALIDAVVKAVLFYEDEQVAKIERVFMCGRVALIRNLDTFLQRTLGMKVELWNPAKKMKIAKNKKNIHQFRAEAMALPVSLGMAGHRFTALNLAPKNRSRNRFLKNAIMAVGICVVLAALVFSNNIISLVKVLVQGENPALYVGKSKTEVVDLLGQPFMKDFTSPGGAYDEVWMYHPRSRSASTLLIRMKYDTVVDVSYQ